jgi:hypothetical protein
MLYLMTPMSQSTSDDICTMCVLFDQQDVSHDVLPLAKPGLGEEGCRCAARRIAW